MQAPPVPVITPKTLQFIHYEAEKQTQTLLILNPLPFDVHFKVDISNPDQFGISLNRGIINACQKLPLEVICKTQVSCVDSIQLRFYKWSRPRQGQQRAGPQRYLGFRQIQITVGANAPEAFPSEACRASIPESANTRLTPPSQTQNPGEPSVEGNQKKIQVVTKLILMLALISIGLGLNYYGDIVVVENVCCATLAIVCYTLATVLLIQLVTFR